MKPVTAEIVVGTSLAEPIPDQQQAAIIAKGLVEMNRKIVTVANINENMVTLMNGQTTCEPVVRIAKVQENVHCSQIYIIQES